MKRSRLLLLALVVLLASGCALQAQADQPVQPAATFEEFLAGLEKFMIGQVWGYRGDAAKAEAKGLNGDAIRRLCEGDILAQLENLRAEWSSIPSDWVHTRWGVLHGEILDESEEVISKVKQQCWW